MMKRTYRSKKELQGSLGHRNVYTSKNDKTTDFDAFYIQNIIQTKREMCNVVFSNKSRNAVKQIGKRKLVKRIPKESNVTPESVSQPTYLTPDKSIHVNKAPDPFDQLLNSSSNVIESPKTSRKFIPIKCSKTYSRRKTPNVKKHDYSSSSEDLEADKENAHQTSSPQNVTDIKNHKLVIEKESNNKCERITNNDSIDNIVKNVSSLKILCYVSEAVNNDSSNKILNVKRQTNTILSPHNVPLSSTPFTEKIRGKSIYNFSPIPLCFGDRLTYDSIEEEKYNTVDIPPTNLSEPKVPEMCDLQLVNNVISSPILCFKKIENKSRPETDQVLSTLKCCNGVDINGSGKEKSFEKETPYDNIVDTSLLYTTEMESFHGFSESVINKKDSLIKLIAQEDANIIINCKENYRSGSLQKENVEEISIINTQAETKHSKHTFKSSQNDNNIIPFKTSEINSKNTVVDHIINNSREMEKDDIIVCGNSMERIDEFQIDIILETEANYLVQKSLHNSDENDLENTIQDPNKITAEDNSIASKYGDCERTKISVLENTRKAVDVDTTVAAEKDLTQEHLKNFENTIPSQCLEFSDEKVTTISVSSESDLSQNYFDESDNVSVNGIHFSRNSTANTDSLYNTCNSEQGFDLNSDDVTREPRVILNKLNDSIFLKFYEHMPNYSLSEFVDEHLNESNAHTSSDKLCMKGIVNTTSDNIELEESLYCYKNSSNDNSESASSSEEEERCFVTTRRRNDITVESKVKTNDSVASTESSECDKTVFSNRISEVLPNETDSTLNDSYKLISDDESRRLTLEQSIVRNTRGCNKSITEPKVSQNESLKCSGINGRTSPEGRGIVLQPGKKWERSLSIYRRMTLMANNLNSSQIEESNGKGRKHRLSVINTMEMQELEAGSPHNDSISSRRSTYASRPSKSTIRIVKEPNSSRVSLCSTTVYEDLRGFLSEDCDDTVVELSKLSIADSDHEVTVVEKFHDSSQRSATARDYVLRRCNQSDVILFDECYPETVLKNCHKIGEGVYGEVYLWRARDGPRVMKIVPVAGNTKVNGEHQKDYSEITSEIVIAMELSALRAPIAEFERLFDEKKDIDTLDLHDIDNATDVFNEVLAVRCVYGKYPSRLLDLWDLYDECKGSDNDNPVVLPRDQQYIVLELANAGQDLESYQFNNAEQAHALFLQVAFGLAVGEEAFQFEHRDLHWGNVLIAPTEQKYGTFVLCGRVHRVPRCGVRATIIDYSLSRLSLPLAGAAGAQESASLYNDLAADDGLFEAHGDYQFDVYRCMRDRLGNEWKNYEPYTNILWLHYTVDKMITALRYKRVNTKVHKHYIAKLKGIKNRVLGYGSAAQFVLTDNEF